MAQLLQLVKGRALTSSAWSRDIGSPMHAFTVVIRPCGLPFCEKSYGSRQATWYLRFKYAVRQHVAPNLHRRLCRRAVSRHFAWTFTLRLDIPPGAARPGLLSPARIMKSGYVKLSCKGYTAAPLRSAGILGLLGLRRAAALHGLCPKA